MKYYSFYSNVVPIGGLIGYMVWGLWGVLMLLVAYALGYYFMGGLRALWRRM